MGSFQCSFKRAMSTANQVPKAGRSTSKQHCNLITVYVQPQKPRALQHVQFTRNFTKYFIIEIYGWVVLCVHYNSTSGACIWRGVARETPIKCKRAMIKCFILPFFYSVCYFFFVHRLHWKKLSI